MKAVQRAVLGGVASVRAVWKREPVTHVVASGRGAQGSILAATEEPARCQISGSKGAHRLRIATVTITPSQDPERTRQTMQDVIQQTLCEYPDVRLFLFGEAILGWFSHPDGTAPYQQSVAEPIPGPSTDAICQLACCEGIYICFGIAEREGDQIYNSQVLVSPNGEILAVHRKFWIMNRAFAPGELRLTSADVDGAKVAVLVCADVRSRKLLRMLRREQVDVVLAGLADLSTDPKLSQMIGTFFDAWAFTANRFGQEGKMNWSGITTITDPWGHLVQSHVGSECVLIQEVPLSRLRPLARFTRRSLVLIKGIGLALSMVFRSIMQRRSIS